METMNDMPPIRKQVIINLEEYGYKGEIVLEELTARRHYDLKNHIGEAMLTDERTKESYKKAGDMEIYTFLAYIVKAPFMGSKSAGKDAYLNFVDKLPFEGALLLTKRLNDEIVGNFATYRLASRLVDNPLPSSEKGTQAEDGTNTVQE